MSGGEERWCPRQPVALTAPVTTHHPKDPQMAVVAKRALCPITDVVSLTKACP
jgi:hypothetical protein